MEYVVHVKTKKQGLKSITFHTDVELKKADIKLFEVVADVDEEGKAIGSHTREITT
jgi:hypothetical protein